MKFPSIVVVILPVVQPDDGSPTVPVGDRVPPSMTRRDDDGVSPERAEYLAWLAKNPDPRD